jgi:prepilin-type N-terminal cleavage/methylation domain-containing protein
MQSIRRPTRSGFTLIEVMVALGVASGAFILLLGANRSALQRSIRARDRIRLEQACESKLDEILSGAETSLSGQLAGRPGYTWHVLQEPAQVDNVTRLMRGTFQVDSPSGPAVSRAFLHYGKLQDASPQGQKATTP